MRRHRAGEWRRMDPDRQPHRSIRHRAPIRQVRRPRGSRMCAPHRGRGRPRRTGCRGAVLGAGTDRDRRPPERETRRHSRRAAVRSSAKSSACELMMASKAPSSNGSALKSPTWKSTPERRGVRWRSFLARRRGQPPRRRQRAQRRPQSRSRNRRRARARRAAMPLVARPRPPPGAAMAPWSRRSHRRWRRRWPMRRAWRSRSRGGGAARRRSTKRCVRSMASMISS